MKIAIIGSRGIPARYGGFETFVEHLSEILANAGHEVTVIGEKGNAGASIHKAGNITVAEAPYAKSKNPLLFYFSSLKMARSNFDAVLVCGVGGALFYSLLIKNKTLVLTNVDGLEHLRGKYSFLKKIFVRISQKLTKLKSDIVIADSVSVGHFWTDTLHTPVHKMHVITYGADPVMPFSQAILDKYKLTSGSYFLLIARLVPENNIFEIIQGFNLSGTDKMLVIVGGLEKTKYLERLQIISNQKIIFTDAIYSKQACDSLRIGACAYIHGHSVGGTNPSLLEAMSASCICLCHDNVFNREVTSSQQLYFHSADELSHRIRETEKMQAEIRDQYRTAALKRVVSNYSWTKIGADYIELFSGLNARRKRI